MGVEEAIVLWSEKQLTENVTMTQTYWGPEVAKNLGIGSSTLGKYFLALEETGYPFDRGNTLDKYTRKTSLFYI